MFSSCHFGHCFTGKRAWHRLPLPPAWLCWTRVNVKKLPLASRAAKGTSSKNTIPGASAQECEAMEKFGLPCFPPPSNLSWLLTSTPGFHLPPGAPASR